MYQYRKEFSNCGWQVFRVICPFGVEFLRSYNVSVAEIFWFMFDNC